MTHTIEINGAVFKVEIKTSLNEFLENVEMIVSEECVLDGEGMGFWTIVNDLVVVAKKSCKEFGIKGFRKLKLKRELYVIGKQCHYLNKHIAVQVIKYLESLGFVIQDKKTCMSLNDKGMLDTITIGRF